MPSGPAPAILFVDDQPEVTSALELAFHRKPFEIHTANSASAALRVLSERSIDVVVSDEQMPGMTGSQLLTVIRNRHPETIRIVLSGQANLKATLAAINEARAHHFLVKPCSVEEIVLCVTRALGEREHGLSLRRNERERLEAAAGMSKEFDSALRSLWVAFQPIVRPESFEVFGYEALVRSHHAGMETPDRLFEASEALQSVARIESNIRGLIADRITEAADDVRFFVNVHPHSLADSELYSSTSALYASRHRVFLEITERDKLEHVPGATDALVELRSLGYRIAIDDLGAGYAGLNSFALIRPDLVKFDMELIRDIHLSATKCSVVGLMTRLCKEMDILTVAEGIETENEYEKVVELGCDLLQGFLISRPTAEFISPRRRQTEGACV